MERGSKWILFLFSFLSINVTVTRCFCYDILWKSRGHVDEKQGGVGVGL